MTATLYELTVDMVEVSTWSTSAQGRKPMGVTVSAASPDGRVSLEINVNPDAAPPVGERIMVTVDWQPE